MTKRWLVCLSAIMLVAACGTGGGATATPGGGARATATPGGGAGATAAPSGAGMSGTAVLGAWESSPSERSALSSAVASFNVVHPDLQISQTTIAGNFRAEMITRFGAHNPPDLFYVNAEYARDWADQGFLQPLDDWIARDHIDTSKFFPDYLNIFKGSDGKIYGLPKDGNTIAMAYNTDLVPTPPTTMDELIATANSLKGTGTLTAPLCLNPGLDRGLAFMYAQGGSLLSADGKSEAITTDASKASVQWYMDLFKNGLGMAAPANSWCGEQLGKGNAAIVFEGGWLYGYMNDTFPDTHWAFAEMPTGSTGSKVTISYTAAYSIGADSANKDQAWEAMKYLTGPQGMAVWTGGGIAVPSRSDVPVPAGFDTIVKGASYSKPGSGFIKSYNDIQTAFSSAFLKQIQDGTFLIDPVVNDTAALITTVLAGGTPPPPSP